MKQQIKKPTSGRIMKWLICVFLVLGIFIDLVILGCSVSTGDSLIASASLVLSQSNYTPVICMAFVMLLAIFAVAAVAGGISTLWRGRAVVFPFAVGLSVDVIMLVLGGVFEIFNFGGTFWTVLHLILMFGGTLYTIVCRIVNPYEAGKKNAMAEKSRRGAILTCGAISMLLSLSLFCVPFCSYTVNETVYTVLPLAALTRSSDNITNLVVFVSLFVLFSISFVFFLKSFESYARSLALYAAKMRNVIALNTLIAGAYFVGGVAYCAVRNAKGRMFSTSSYLPVLLMIALAIAYAFLVRTIDHGEEPETVRGAKAARIEFFIYGLLMTAVTVGASLTDIVRVKIVKPEQMEALHINGFRIFTTYTKLDSGFQLMAFFLLAILTIMAVLFVSSLVSLISKSKFFYKITLAEVISGAVFSLLIGLFGKYYEIVQRMNEDALRSWISEMTELDGFDVAFKVTSRSFYWFLGAVAIILIVLIRRPYTKGTIGDLVVAVDEPLQRSSDASSQGRNTLSDATDVSKKDVDPCPAFTELDGKAEEFDAELEHVKRSVFESPTLPSIVQFVVNYARDSRLHLSYTAEDIAAFIAGLGATRLTILQGMSGTGKTSLPKIFTEAVMGNCELVEVESSWRDKNELLGYYNEFSRTYTPKKFTQALYKAKLNPDRLTFIVLDEMNLSRIEYYFSDFLSLMENEEDKREIKLLNVGLYRREGGKRYAYLGLADGHTIKIPNNVWFIGTANRDESTFEISDKVYDRAHTMNFNKRASKVLSYREPIPQRYLSVAELLRLIEEAKQSVHFDLDACTVVKEAEELLAPYNISFGNRVANQIENFVKIYAACFTPSEAVVNEALEKILLSKMVSKLEFKSVDNKAQLAAEFRRLKLNKCSDFILKLNED